MAKSLKENVKAKKIDTTDRVEVTIEKDSKYLKKGDVLSVHPSVKAKYRKLGLVK